MIVKQVATALTNKLVDKLYHLDFAFKNHSSNKNKYDLSDLETLSYNDPVYPLLRSLEKEYLHEFDFGVELKDLTPQDLGVLGELIVYNVEKLPFRREFYHDIKGYFVYDDEEFSIDLPIWSIVNKVCLDRTYLEKKALRDLLLKTTIRLLNKAKRYVETHLDFNSGIDESHDMRKSYL